MLKIKVLKMLGTKIKIKIKVLKILGTKIKIKKVINWKGNIL